MCGTNEIHPRLRGRKWWYPFLWDTNWDTKEVYLPPEPKHRILLVFVWHKSGLPPPARGAPFFASQKFTEPGRPPPAWRALFCPAKFGANPGLPPFAGEHVWCPPFLCGTKEGYPRLRAVNVPAPRSQESGAEPPIDVEANQGRANALQCYGRPSGRTRARRPTARPDQR